MTASLIRSIGLRAGAALAAIVFAFALGAPLALAAPDSSGLEPQGIAWQRLSGADRYATSIAIAKAAFPSGCDDAIIATAKDFPDALAAGSLSGYLSCPILLTRPDALNPETEAALKDLNVKRAVIVGGEAAVSNKVQQAVEMNAGVTTTRIAGINRIGTSVELMKRLHGGKALDTVIIATGMKFPDALSVGPYACRYGVPILLVGNNGSLTADEVALIKECGIARALIIGGPAVVSENVEAQLATVGIVDTAVERIYGGDRYATSRAFADWALSHGLYPGNMAVATGTNFPDALSGAALSGKLASPLLLVKDLTSPTLKTVEDFKTAIENPYIFGGTSAVSAEIENYLNSLL